MNQATTTSAATIDNALRAGAAVRSDPTAGVLILRDADRVDFLQRMTTNNIAALREANPASPC